MRGARALVVPVVLALAAADARAEPVVLRMASVGPEGSAYAREFHAFSRDVTAGTNGRVSIKWYLGGMAGDELMVLARIQRGQIDGAAGAMLCERLAPSMRVLHLFGIASSSAEAKYLIDRLRPSFDREFARAGFANLGEAPLGTVVVFSRTPLTQLDQLKRARLWIWELDELGRAQFAALGFHIVPMALHEAAPAYEAGVVDGIISPAAIALAFQWSARTKYFTDLHNLALTGCLVVANRAFDELSNADQQAVRSAGSKLVRRIGEVGHYQDEQLLGGLLARQGLKAAPLAEGVLGQLVAAARAVRDRFDERLISKPVLATVLAIVADYRTDATHR
jgi:TRAP-type C4-dicarboxylate transport system substrate-binding protein